MFTNPLPGIPNVESPFFEQIAEAEQWDAETLEIGRVLRDQGYVVIPFPEPDIDAMAEQIKAELKPRYDWDWWRKEGRSAGDGLRIQDAWEFNENTRRIAANKKILALLSRLYSKEAFPFQTLTFATGTQQGMHSDTAHFSSTPERFMCGVWLALEDTDEENGALQYFPGSHKLPIYSNEHLNACAATSVKQTDPYQMLSKAWMRLAEAHGFRREVFKAKKGQALIWAANLLHGGGKHVNPERTRWSQVTHYYFKDCCYHTPMFSDPMYGNVYYREPMNVLTGEPEVNRYAGKVVSRDVIAAAKPRRRDLPEGFSPMLYLQANPDVKASGMDATEHYMLYGAMEGRPIRR